MDVKRLVRANLDRVVAVALVIFGAVAVIVGWFGVSGTGLAAEQIPYLVSGGIGGTLLVVIGCTAWTSADLQDEWRRLDEIDERLAQLSSARSKGTYDAASANGHATSELPEKTVPQELQS